ncbi:MAG: hypothetical protein K6B65_00820 [Bacilli bacterium]|nr:hypothetical protein [Bacilli bacterium]
MFIFLLVVITVSSFLLEGIAFFNNPFSSLMTDLEFYVVFAICGLSFIGFLYISHRHFRVKPSAFWISLMVILFVGNLIATYLFPSETSGTTLPIGGGSIDWTYSLEYHLRIRYVLAFGVACIDMYILYAIAPKLLRSSRTVVLVHYLFIVVVIIAVIWSFVAEADIYAYYLNPEMDIDPNKCVSSFFLNRNTYAAVLFVGMASCGIVNADSHHFWNYILMGLFYLELFFTISKTGILIGSAFLVAYVFYRFVVNVKYHKVRAFLGLILFWLAIIMVFTVGELQLFPRNTIFVKLYLNFKEAFLSRVEHGFLDYRIEIWTNCYAFQKTNGVYLIVGVGEFNALTLLSAMWGTEGPFYFTHNGFVHQLFAGGFIRLAIYVIMLVFVLIAAIVNATNKRRLAIPCLLGILAILGQSITETTTFLGADTKALYYSLAFILPLLTDFYQDRHPEVKEEELAAFNQIGTTYSYAIPAHRKALLATSILLPLLFFFLGVAPLMGNLDSMWYHQFYDHNLIAISIAVLVIAPGVFFLGFHDSGVRGRLIVSLTFIFSFSAIAAVLLSPKTITVIFSSVVLASWAAFVLAISTNRLGIRSLRGLVVVYLSVGFASAAFVGVNHLFVYAMPEIFSESSITLNVCLLIAEILGYFIVVYTLTPFHGFGFPLGHFIYRADRKISYALYKYEKKTDVREEIYAGDYVGKYYKKELNRR